MKEMKRRDVLKCGMVGLVGLSLNMMGCGGGTSGGRAVVAAAAAGIEPGDIPLDLTITEALFEMVDGRPVYMWAFEDPNQTDLLKSGPRFPGPVITAREGETIYLSITNALRENHGFAIHSAPGALEVVNFGVIAPGEAKIMKFTAPAAGTYLYRDPLNAPVNRVLGLHGAMVILPAAGNSPYSSPTPAVQRLFNDLGTTAQFPKNALSPAGWQQERSRIWLHHQIDPAFNALAERGVTIVPAVMKSDFLPRYFTINGKSGAFASMDHDSTIEGRIGEPMLVRILNAGLFTHSNHLHANHFYVTAVNNVVRDNVYFLDSFHIFPEDRVDWLVPFVRPPDIPGDQSIPLRTLIPQELALVMGDVPQSPLGYPMHCHMEPSQTAAGGNYPQGATVHFDFLGDLDGVDFPH